MHLAGHLQVLAQRGIAGIRAWPPHPSSAPEREEIGRGEISDFLICLPKIAFLLKLGECWEGLLTVRG